MEYFRLAASDYPDTVPARSVEVPHAGPDISPAASTAMCFLGQMYWRGEGAPQNNATARRWFERGAEAENGMCLNGLAVMHMEGIAGPKVRSSIHSTLSW